LVQQKSNGGGAAPLEPSIALAYSNIRALCPQKAEKTKGKVLPNALQDRKYRLLMRQHQQTNFADDLPNTAGYSSGREQTYLFPMKQSVFRTVVGKCLPMPVLALRRREV